jgi:hypothetical protein
MDIYTYVAESNPYQAKAILHKYGYSVRDAKTNTDIGKCLKDLVLYEGEDALRDIVDNHPDKGIILEMYQPKQNSSECKGGSCNCAKCISKEIQYMNFSGKDEEKSGKSIREVSIFILASALLLASAIIVKK